jgi:hypothetical protein
MTKMFIDIELPVPPFDVREAVETPSKLIHKSKMKENIHSKQRRPSVKLTILTNKEKRWN